MPFGIYPEMTLPLESQILKKQGKDSEALSLIESAVKDKSTQLQILHAEMLLAMNKNEQAASLRIIDRLIKSRSENGAATAAIYNNLAWAQLQTENLDKRLP